MNINDRHINEGDPDLTAPEPTWCILSA